MKIQYTTIVGVESTADHVEILIRHAGSESWQLPVRVLISPHDDYINLHFGGIDGKVTPKQTIANGAEIHYKPLKD